MPNVTRADNEQDIQLADHEARIKSLEEARREHAEMIKDATKISEKNATQLSIQWKINWLVIAMVVTAVGKYLIGL